MKKHYNIPVFITHSGCKNDCVFCNQKIITGQSESSGESETRAVIEKFISTHNKNNRTGDDSDDYACTEIAFFGGSFTGLEKSVMIKFLETANEYISENKIIKGIRISTRPDYISGEILDILLKYNVKSIELGIQSMFDDVLSACRRGHTVQDSERACKIIKSAGVNLNLTGQMMLGLPCSNRGKDIATAEKLADIGVDCARVYPAAVLAGTRLFDMYKSGEYVPLSLDEAVFRAKEIKKIFDLNKIKILRMGLCSSDIGKGRNGSTVIAAGPYHPAFGELVESEIIYDRLAEEIQEMCSNGYQPPHTDTRDTRDTESIIIRVDKKDMSKTIGHKRKNIERLKKRFPDKNIIIAES